MADEARLRHLIEEAKTRRQDHFDKQLEEFKRGLEAVLSQELCTILGLSYRRSTAGEKPTATFSAYNAVWAISRQADGGWNLQMSRHGPVGAMPPIPSGFSTQDELLLLIDKSRH